MSENDIKTLLQQMAEGYEKQLPLYEKMYDLALEQEKCVQAKEVDTDLLFSLINQRQELINSLETMQEEIKGSKENILSSLGIQEFSISNIKEKYSGLALTHLSGIMEKYTAVLAKIKELDVINEEILRQRIKETSDNLTSIQREKKARNAYEKKVINKDGVFIDFSK